MARFLAITLTALLAGTAWADWNEALPLLKLAQLESRDARAAESEEERLAHWNRSLELTEEAYSVVAVDDNPYSALLAQLAERAFYAEKLDKAEHYAKSALARAAEARGPASMSIGEALHYGHLVLGKLALLDDDIEAAREHLLEAGKTPGSPALSSFGPNMMLARLLLERGEREVVLEYFTLCRTFWDSGRKRGVLDRWSLVVQNGGIPEFGANLVYGS